MKLRELYISEHKEAIELSLYVFMECGTADFNADGLEAFKNFIYNPDLIDELTIIGAFEAENLVGIVGTKNQGEHISMFFIDPKFHRKGIGRKLFDFAYANQVVKEITVNSSSYAVLFYENLGFSKMADEQETNGLRYIPMKKG